MTAAADKGHLIPGSTEKRNPKKTVAALVTGKFKSAFPDGAPKDEPEPPKKSKADYNGMTRKQLEAAYTKKFGKVPHPRTKAATILAALTEG